MLKKVDENGGDCTRPKKRKPKASTTRFITRWHRRLGLMSALLVLILSVTGLILNRTVDWQLDSQLIRAPWIASWYGLAAKSDPVGFQAGAHWVTVLDDQIYIDQKHVGLKDSEILGASTWDNAVIIASDIGLIAYAPDGQLFDQIGNDELPGKITRIGQLADGTLSISTDNGLFTASDNLRQWSKAVDASNWSRPGALPADINTAITKLYNGRGLPLSRILLDVHSGRFFGAWGVYAMDVAAIFLILLTFSGFYNWWVRR